MSKQVALKNLDLSKITYTSMNKGKNGGKVMYVLYNGETLKVQLPKMTIPFGASDYNDNKKFSINFSFDMETESHKKSLDILKALDEKLIKDGATNSKDWFGSERSVDGVRETFQSQLKIPDSDSKYQPRIKAGLMTSNQSNAFRCNFVDMAGNKVDVNQDNAPTMIPSRSTGTAILECVGVWVVQKSLTLTWKVSKMKYEKGTNDDLDFESDSDSESESASVPVKVSVESEESEGSDLDEEESVVKQVAKPTAKRVSSKAKKAMA
jgi:hypothetical protein